MFCFFANEMRFDFLSICEIIILTEAIFLKFYKTF